MNAEDILRDNRWVYDFHVHSKGQMHFYGKKETDMVLFVKECGEWFTYVPHGRHVELKNYFYDFQVPTKKEKDMFFMVTGYTIPWSEEYPLVL